VSAVCDDIANPPKARVPLQCGQYKLGKFRRRFADTSDAVVALDIHADDFDSLAANLVRRFEEHKSDLEAILSLGAQVAKDGGGS